MKGDAGLVLGDRAESWDSPYGVGTE
jgi:hypothetical protein